MTSPLVSIDDNPLQSWHFDAVSCRGSPFHSFNRTRRDGPSTAIVGGGGPVNLVLLGRTTSQGWVDASYPHGYNGGRVSAAADRCLRKVAVGAARHARQGSHPCPLGICAPRQPG